MCIEIFFKSEGKLVGSAEQLAGILGGYDKLAVQLGYALGDFVGDICLCGLDVETTFRPTDYILSQWEDGVDYTARKPEWLVEQERRERDRARYDAAMAETRGPV